MSITKICRQLFRAEKNIISRRYFQSVVNSELLKERAGKHPHLLQIHNLFNIEQIKLRSPKYKAEATLSEASWKRLLDNSGASNYQNNFFCTLMTKLVKFGFPQELLDSLVLYPEYAEDVINSTFFAKLEELHARAIKDNNWNKFNNAYEVASEILANLPKWPHLKQVFDCFTLAVYDEKTIEKIVNLPSIHILLELGSGYSIPLDLALDTASFALEAVSIMRKYGKSEANSTIWNCSLLIRMIEKYNRKESVLLTESDLETIKNTQSTSSANFFPKARNSDSTKWMEITKPMELGLY